jgi:hypothetical protein
MLVYRSTPFNTCEHVWRLRYSLGQSEGAGRTRSPIALPLSRVPRVGAGV